MPFDNNTDSPASEVKPLFDIHDPADVRDMMFHIATAEAWDWSHRPRWMLETVYLLCELFSQQADIAQVRILAEELQAELFHQTVEFNNANDTFKIFMLSGGFAADDAQGERSLFRLKTKPESEQSAPSASAPSNVLSMPTQILGDAALFARTKRRRKGGQ
jgi:hypothetical protein